MNFAETTFTVGLTNNQVVWLQPCLLFSISSRGWRGGGGGGWLNRAFTVPSSEEHK